MEIRFPLQPRKPIGFVTKNRVAWPTAKTKDREAEENIFTFLVSRVLIKSLSTCCFLTERVFHLVFP